MADDKSKRGKADRSRVNTGEKYEVAHMAKQAGASAGEVRKAAQKAGPSRSKVKAALQK